MGKPKAIANPRLMELDRHIGARLREARQARGWSLTALVNRIDPPITYQQLQKYEIGRNRLACCRLWEIAELLDQPIEYFFPDDAGTSRKS